MKSCIVCGLKFEGDYAEDKGLQTFEGSVCVFDLDDEGNIKSQEELFREEVDLIYATGTDDDRDLAVRVARRKLKALPYWQKNPSAVLEGKEATDEEFATTMARME